MSPQSVSQFVQRYPGVEGFYFINRSADLGFIRVADARPIKETFPQLHDRRFVRQHPNFVPQLENFLRDLQELSFAYLNGSETGMELGYVLPAGDNNHEWQTATLVLHEWVSDAIRQDQDEKSQLGVSERVTNSATIDNLQGACSIHRGLNFLVNYTNPLGEHAYFPALFFQTNRTVDDPPTADEVERRQEPGLRVVNLLWRSETSEHGSAPHHRLIFDMLRRNLEIRATIARDRHPMVDTKAIDAVPAPPNLTGADQPTQQ